MLCYDADAERDQPLADGGQLVGHERPRRDGVRRRRDGDLQTPPPQQFRQTAAHVVVVEVVHEDWALGFCAGQDVVRRENPAVIRRIDRVALFAEQLPRPAGAGRHHRVVATEVQHVLRGQPAAAIDLDVGHGLNQARPVVPHPRPSRQPRKCGLQRHAAAQLAARFGHGDAQAPQPQHPGAFKPGRPRSDDQHRRLGIARRRAFGMPTPPPLLAHGGVLRAANRNAVVIGGDADVAADALADFVLAPLVDLPRQERVRYRRAGGTDQVQNAAAHLPHHFVRRGETSHAHHRPVGQRLHETVDRLLRPLFAEPRRRGLDGPIRRLHIPQVRHIGKHGDHFVRFGRKRCARNAEQLVGAEAHRHRATAADGVLDVFENLPQQADAVAPLAAVFVRALVQPRQQERVGAVAHAGVDGDDVKAGALGAEGGLHVPAAQIAHIPPVHGARRRQAHPAGIGAVTARVRDGQRLRPRQPVRRAAAVPKLDAGQRPVAVYGVHHHRVDRDVVVVPQTAIGQRRVVGARMNGAVAGVDNTPAALGAHFAHGGAGMRHGVAGAERVRRLVEPVRRGDRPDPHRLEQHVVAGVPAHAAPSACSRSAMRSSTHSMPMDKRTRSLGMGLRSPSME